MGEYRSIISDFGISPLVAAEFLPALEAVAVSALNKQIKVGGEHG